MALHCRAVFGGINGSGHGSVSSAKAMRHDGFKWPGLLGTISFLGARVMTTSELESCPHRSYRVLTRFPPWCVCAQLRQLIGGQHWTSRRFASDASRAEKRHEGHNLFPESQPHVMVRRRERLSPQGRGGVIVWTAKQAGKT